MASAPHLDQDALQSLHRTIAGRVERGELPGAVTLVARIGDDDSAAATDTDGRYGWDGGYGTFWSNHPHLGLCTIFLSQTTDAIFNGTTAEFDALAVRAAA